MPIFPIVSPIDWEYVWTWAMAWVSEYWLPLFFAPVLVMLVAFLVVLPALISNLRVLMGFDVTVYSSDGSSFEIPRSEWDAIRQQEALLQAGDLARGTVDIYGASYNEGGYQQRFMRDEENP